jgi:hypothetical protein
MHDARLRIGPSSGADMKRPWDAIAWWELRRIPYNLLLAVLGLATILVIGWIGSHLSLLDQDVLNPFGFVLGIIAYGIAANVFYTLGWISELLWSGGDTSRTAPMRRTVFWAAAIFSAFVTVSPAVLVPAAWALLR